MTDQLAHLSKEMDYYSARKATSLFSVESVFYSIMLAQIAGEIEQIISEQFCVGDANVYIQ